MTELIEDLRRMYDEQRRSRFPRGTLPAAYRDLSAEWAELDGFVAGLTERALKGGMLHPEEVVPRGHERFRERLEGFRREYPDISRKYWDAFQRLEEMLRILRAIAEHVDRSPDA